jgi:hypothetical protein
LTKRSLYPQQLSAPQNPVAETSQRASQQEKKRVYEITRFVTMGSKMEEDKHQCRRQQHPRSKKQERVKEWMAETLRLTGSTLRSDPEVAVAQIDDDKR